MMAPPVRDQLFVAAGLSGQISAFLLAADLHPDAWLLVMAVSASIGMAPWPRLFAFFMTLSVLLAGVPWLDGTALFHWEVLACHGAACIVWLAARRTAFATRRRARMEP